MVQIAPYGSWHSPIRVETLTSSSIRLEDIVLDGSDVYWSEQHPNEQGRYAIERWTPGGDISEVLPPPWSARTRVHEYGGAAFTVVDGTVIFSNDADRRIYRVAPDGRFEVLTPDADIRHADFTVDRPRNRLIAVREDHTTGAAEPVNTLGTIPLDGSLGGTVLVDGHDFFASPRVSPDGAHLAWTSWDHPNMPWDGCELWVGRFADDGSVVDRRLVAGGPTESIFQPIWSPGGVLYFTSDRTGFWNIYRDTGAEPAIVLAAEAEYGRPLWVFSIKTFGFLDDERIVASSFRNGRWGLSIIDVATGDEQPIDLPSTAIGDVVAEHGVAVFVAGSPVEPSTLVRLDVANGRLTKLRASFDVDFDRGYISVPGEVEFPTTGNRTAYGFFYPPQNKDFAAPAGELPPLIVQSHGGPTSSTTTALRLPIQYWTSRGFAVLDVEYGGSTNYGRAYRQRLDGQWGVVDIDDCVAGAQHLISEGLVDPDRIVIQGWSASGYTTLSALAFRNFFRAGISSYGIGDLEAMVRDTHKFESRYLDRLIGPYPERADLYRERSAIHYVSQISAPMLILQGAEDKVVPPNQAEMMYEAVRANGLPVAMVIYPGEQHGFRKAETIQHSHAATLGFLGRVFGFTPADDVPDLEIANLPHN